MSSISKLQSVSMERGEDAAPAVEPTTGPAHRDVVLAPDFFDEASALRAHFDKAFEDPRALGSINRFVWDYWHVPDQFCYVRTAAVRFFPADVYARFQRRLAMWGLENLGCRAFSGLWLSYYVSDCYQQIHTDVPHGAWAIVYSLTDWSTRRFRGGETLLVPPRNLSYWSQFQDEASIEADSFFETHPSHFNQLIAFDPRLPHGVSRVEGEADPRGARLVIHGWFSKPECEVFGPLSGDLQPTERTALVDRLNKAAKLRHPECFGMTILRARVSPTGRVVCADVMTNAVRARSGRDDDAAAAVAAIAHDILNLRFPVNYAPSAIIIPIEIPTGHG